MDEDNNNDSKVSPDEVIKSNVNKIDSNRIIIFFDLLLDSSEASK